MSGSSAGHSERLPNVRWIWRSTPLAPRQARDAANALVLIVTTFLGIGCAASEIAGTGGPSPVISPSQYRLAVGDTLRIRATYKGQPCDCLWVADDTTRAAVDAAGLVRAMATGWVTVIATVKGDSNLKASGLVEVVAP